MVLLTVVNFYSDLDFRLPASARKHLSKSGRCSDDGRYPDQLFVLPSRQRKGLLRVTDFAWLGHEFVVTCGSQSLRLVSGEKARGARLVMHAVGGVLGRCAVNYLHLLLLV